MPITVLLREVTNNDMELVLSWRNNPLIWAGFYQQGRENKPIQWETHYRWWHSRHNWKRWIIQVNDGTWTRDVGFVNLSQLDHWRPEVGYAIGEVTLWGKGVCKHAVSQVLDWLKENKYARVHTSVLKTNIASIKVLEGLGFTRIGEARKEEWEYEKELT